jgi:poly(3-hydroxyalkanoate) synthetase
MDVHLIEWGDPQPADKYLTIDDYVNGYLTTASISCVTLRR